MLLIPTVTSPSLRPSPDLILSREGPDSATHNLCAGSVNTPMLGLLRDVTGFVSVTVAIPALFWERELLAEAARAIGGKEGDMAFLSLRRVDGDVLLFVEETRPSGAPVVAQLELLH